MGQKIRPIGFRIGITENWRSRWYADKKTFGKYLVEDQRIRLFIKKNYGFAAIESVEIERTTGQTTVILNSARPGIIIGRKGQEVDKLKNEIEAITGNLVNIRIQEIAQPELAAQLVAEGIREQMEKRASFRRTMKRAIEAVMDAGAKGCKVRMAGRLGGSEMARVEVMNQGSVPLQTLRARINYGFTEAATTYGHIGIKVWIYIGDSLEKKEEVSHGVDAQAGEVPQEPAGTDQGVRQPV
jgi:small subunit ribosomal protein S3